MQSSDPFISFPAAVAPPHLQAPPNQQYNPTLPVPPPLPHPPTPHRHYEAPTSQHFHYLPPPLPTPQRPSFNSQVTTPLTSHNYHPYLSNSVSPRWNDMPVPHLPHWQSIPAMSVQPPGLPGITQPQNLGPPPSSVDAFNAPVAYPFQSQLIGQGQNFIQQSPPAVSQHLSGQDQTDKEEGELSEVEVGRHMLARSQSGPSKGPTRNPDQRQDAVRTKLSMQQPVSKTDDHGKGSTPSKPMKTLDILTEEPGTRTPPRPARSPIRRDSHARRGSNDAISYSPNVPYSERSRRTASDRYRPTSNGHRQQRAAESAVASRKNSVVELNRLPSNYHKHPVDTDGITQEYLAQERSKAKVFVRAWNRNGLTFDELVAEDLDPQILKGIYDELGIVTKSSFQSKEMKDEGTAHLKVKHGLNNAPPIPNLHQIGHVPETTQRDQSASFRDQNLRIQEEVEKFDVSGRRPISKPGRTTLEASISGVAANTLPNKPTHTNHATSLQTKLPQRRGRSISPEHPKPIHPVPADRESYVARLMAAKNKKLSSEKDSPATLIAAEAKLSEKQSPPKHAISPRPLTNKGQNAVSSTVLASGVVPLPSPNKKRSNSLSAQVTTAAKRKAQTELARKRMEALTSARLRAAQTNAAPVQSLLNPRPVDQQALNSPNEPSRRSSPGAEIVESQHREEIERISTLASPPPSRPSSEEIKEPEMLQELGAETTPAMTISQNQSRIPGLFMTAPPAVAESEAHTASKSSESTSNQPSTIPQLAYSSKPTQVRKRPVASDFNDDIGYYPTTKRPFGQARGSGDDEEMIIEASDDETAPNDHVAPRIVELGEQAPEYTPSTAGSTPINVSQSVVSQHQATTNASLIGRKDLGTKIVPNPAQSHFDPRDKDYLKHQKDILAMKLKIAKLEQKRKVKSLSSHPTTPGSPKLELRPESLDSPHLGDRIAEISRDASGSVGTRHDTPTSAARERSHELSYDASQQTSAAPVPVSSPSADKQASILVGESKSTEIPDWKQRRRTEIQSGIPALEASFADDTRQLELLKDQVKRIEEDMRKKQEDKERLIQELESLGVDTEGMQHSTLQATKDDLMAQMGEQGDVKDPSPMPNSIAASESYEQSLKETSASSMSISSPEESAVVRNQGDVTHNVERMGDDSVSDSADDHTDNKAQNMVHYPFNTLESSISSSQSASVQNFDMKHGAAESSAHFEYGDRSLSQARSESIEDEKEPSLQKELLRASNQSFSAVLKASNDEADQSMSEGEISESEPAHPIDHLEGASKRSGDSEDFSPRDSSMVSGPMSKGGKTDSDHNEEYEPTDVVDTPERDRNWSPGEVLSDASLEYEPPDAILEDAGANHESRESGDEYDPDEDYIPPTLSSNSKPDLKTQPSIPTDVTDTVRQLTKGTHDSKEADSLVTELQPEPLLGSSPTDAVKSASDLPEGDRFTPYNSALMNFKTFRFHPDFANTVRGGFRSTTFTHSIDPDRPLCPFEQAGGICNDEKCDGQHFRSMRIEDQDMLRQVTTSNPGLTAEEMSNFSNGLETVLLKLNQDNIKDPEAIASEIAAYRRRFLKDPSRVL